MTLFGMNMRAGNLDEHLQATMKLDLCAELAHFPQPAGMATPLLYPQPQQRPYTDGHIPHSPHLDSTSFAYSSEDVHLMFHDNVDLQHSIAANYSSLENVPLSTTATLNSTTPSCSSTQSRKSCDASGISSEHSSEGFRGFGECGENRLLQDKTPVSTAEGCSDRFGSSLSAPEKEMSSNGSRTLEAAMAEITGVLNESGMGTFGDGRLPQQTVAISGDCQLGTGVPPVSTMEATSAQGNGSGCGMSASAAVMVVPPPRGRGRHKVRQWRNVGWFSNEHSMNVARKLQRVSKWKSVDQIDGLKVFFRCNRWKRTNCNYRMYVMYYAMDRISLNESGEHDHATLNLAYKPRSHHRKSALRTGARAVIEATPSSSQQLVLDQLILNATSHSSPYLNSTFSRDGSFGNKALDGSCSSQASSSASSRNINDYMKPDDLMENPYQLNDGQNIAELLQVAADMDLTFTFNSRRTCEYCFESNVPEMKGKMVVFSDLGEKVYIKERHNGLDQNGEEWRKADWKQFLWAVRGKCMNALKGI